jgi:hypothetical protein
MPAIGFLPDRPLASDGIRPEASPMVTTTAGKVNPLGRHRWSMSSDRYGDHHGNQQVS